MSILCSIVRTKLVAMWIGPVGVGLFGIFNSAIATFGNFAQLNLRQTAVREMASAEPDAVANLGHAVRRISLWLGLAGGLLMLILSPWLAEASLGSRQGWPSFAWLAVTIALITVNNGEAAIFQGLKQFRRQRRHLHAPHGQTEPGGRADNPRGAMRKEWRADRGPLRGQHAEPYALLPDL